jgi:hypothetical protein
MAPGWPENPVAAPPPQRSRRTCNKLAVRGDRRETAGHTGGDERVPAIARGDTVIVKPSLRGPLTPVAFAFMATEVGLPAGVVNVVQALASMSAPT